MKRNIKIIGLGLCLAFSLQSCEKWFDVTASNQIKAEDQFASVDGFKDALMGVYLALGTPSLYAKDMSYNMMDILSQQYVSFTGESASYANMQSFNYQHIRSEAQIKAVWDKFYYAIANVNSALSYLDKSTFSWTPGEQEILKGEFLALRAFLHFDLMRVFGHAAYADRADLPNKLAIPYALVYHKDYPAQLSYTETFKLMEKDVDEALALLKYDPIHANTLLSASSKLEMNRDGFYDKRNKHLNYYAVKALQARMYAWQGGAKMQLAAAAAEEVIEQSPVQLLKDNQVIDQDKTILSEHIFGLSVANLGSISNPLLEAISTTNYNSLRFGEAMVEELYEVDIPTIGATDVRFNTLLITEPLGMVSIKLRQLNKNDIDFNTIPLMKLPEMYYIAAEYYSQNNLAKAITLLDEVRKSRRIVQPLASNMGQADFNEELLKEYRKEFVSEGQLFFFYKRKGLKQIPNHSATLQADDKIYMLPFPAAEVEFGNRVQ